MKRELSGSDLGRAPVRPAALLPPAAARLTGFCALAALGALQWQRMAIDASAARALAWVGAGAAGGLALHTAARRLHGRWRPVVALAVAAATLIAAFAAAGLDLGLLRPARWTELGIGIGRGLESLSTVKLPYAGSEVWLVRTLELGGALLCAFAGLLAMWPRQGGRGFPFISLALLLVLAITPVVSLGGAQPVVLGAGLAALTVAFLWLERLPMRPGIGVAALLGIALAGALPLGTMADREDPWFDYKAFAEGLGSGEPITFSWDHEYGGITWTREGVEVMRVEAARASYWKLSTLSRFDGTGWSDPGFISGLDGDPSFDLPRNWRDRPEWVASARFSLRRLRTSRLPGAGVTLDVTDASRPVARGETPGAWVARTDLRNGDSFLARAYVPRPAPEELEQASVVEGGTLAPENLRLRLDLRDDALPPPGLRSAGFLGDFPLETADVELPPFGTVGEPRVEYPRIGHREDGFHALRNSTMPRTWQLAQRLSRAADTPYEYVLAVLGHLEDGFTYEELPGEPSPGMPPLEHFLFESREGYCQHFSAAMALLLRMGGVPARVATGFSPGGYSEKRRAWIVRDTDAHSWVEVFFDEIGWVAFDPTPPDTPARSQIAALADEDDDAGAGPSAGGPGEDAADGAGGDPSRQPGTRGEFFSNPATGGSGTAGDETGNGIPVWLLAVLGLLVAGPACVLALQRRRRFGSLGPRERAVAELEAALRASGRPAPIGTTLRQIERWLGEGEAAGYVRALRSGRYGPSDNQPTRAGRAALRRELAAGAGRTGRLRALWALPPRPF